MSNYVHEHYADYEISLDRMSEQFGLSINALSKLFKEEIGIGFKEYVTNLRVEKGKQLLKEEELSVAEITGQLGYTNPSHFIKIFKRYEGITPNQYRGFKRAVDAREDS